MNTKNTTQNRNLTLTDVKLASIYYPILLDLAKHKHCLTYGELIAKAKELHPDDPFIKSAVPVATGRRLDVVRDFTEKHGYPDLTSLIINKVKGECGDGFSEYYDPVKVREAVFANDWSTATTDFDGFTTHLAKKVTEKSKKRPKITKEAAKDLRYRFYKEHETTLPPTIQKKCDLIDRLIMDGIAVEDAFSQALMEL